jgi:hypothetical protein
MGKLKFYWTALTCVTASIGVIYAVSITKLEALLSGSLLAGIGVFDCVLIGFGKLALRKLPANIILQSPLYVELPYLVLLAIGYVLFGNIGAAYVCVCGAPILFLLYRARNTRLLDMIDNIGIIIDHSDAVTVPFTLIAGLFAMWLYKETEEYGAVLAIGGIIECIILIPLVIKMNKLVLQQEYKND